jgi:hypothetical protein
VSDLLPAVARRARRILSGAPLFAKAPRSYHSLNKRKRTLLTDNHR